MTKPARTWTISRARAKLSAVIECARSEGPQTITRDGRAVVVVVSAEEWDQKTRRKGNLAEFFAASPLPGARIRMMRRNDKGQETKL